MVDGPVADASPSDDRRMRIAVIGAGAGGICVTKDLLDAGFDDVVVLERNEGVGGTWLINRYPGCECDVQSALYSFSWAPKPDWSKPYGTQPEILEYLRGLADVPRRAVPLPVRGDRDRGGMGPGFRHLADHHVVGRRCRGGGAGRRRRDVP